MIITIDGPAGSGKSTAARELARRLGFRFLDTGAMYRAVTLAALERRLNLEDTEGLKAIADAIQIELADGRVLLDGRDVTQAIRSFTITTHTRYAADHPGVRQKLVQLQRQIAETGNFVTEGRDQGTIVFPHAECKIFLTADEEVRARRRFEDLRSRGEEVDFDDVLEKQRERDERDRTRPVGALEKTADAIEVNTDGMSPRQVVDRLEKIVSAKRGVRDGAVDQ